MKKEFNNRNAKVQTSVISKNEDFAQQGGLNLLPTQVATHIVHMPQEIS